MKKSIMLMVGGLFSVVLIASATPAYTGRTTNLYLFNDSPRVAPPSVVRSAFDARFPNANVKHWTERKDGQKDSYTAYFKLNGKKLYAYYNANGTWEGTGTPVKWSKDLPANVRNAWKQSDYASWKIMDLRKIKTPNGTLYQLHLNDSPLLDADHDYAFQDECKLIYNDRGVLVTKETR